jgi:hypothetical protein
MKLLLETCLHTYTHIYVYNHTLYRQLRGFHEQFIFIFKFRVYFNTNTTSISVRLGIMLLPGPEHQ